MSCAENPGLQAGDVERGRHSRLSHKHTQRTGQFFSAYDMASYTAGASKEGLKIHSQTVQGVTEEYVTRRKQFKKCKLRWRVSRGSCKSLGWIPFKTGAAPYKNGQLRYAGQYFGLWDSMAWVSTNCARAVSARMRGAGGTPISALKLRLNHRAAPLTSALIWA